MFTYAYTIRMRDTDAAGVVFFVQYLAIAHEAYEAFLASEGIHLGDFLQETSYLIPVVHAEAQYHVSLRLGDTIRISMGCPFIGDSSFTLLFRFHREQTRCAEVRTTHATVSRQTGRKISLPDEILHILSHIKI